MTFPADLFPDTTRVTLENRLAIGGRDLVALAAEHGTPLYVYDVATVLARAGALREALRASYPGTATVCYAAKAYIAPWLLALLAQEGLGLDVVSGGELHVAARAGFPRERVYLHGNCKTESELAYALDQRVGRIVIDNLDEIAALGRLADERGVRQPVLLRLGPGVDVHTHAHLTTGAPDTKFGLDIASGAAETGVRAILAQPSLELRGFHAHIGSQIRDTAPYRAAVERVFAFAAAMREKTGFVLQEVSPGGGYPVRYVPSDPAIDAVAMVREVAAAVLAASQRHGLDQPELTIEPGRAIVAPAGIALYRVGSVKRGARTYVAVDGGMADNIRPAAYGAEYTATLASRVEDGGLTDVAIAGRYCETGDILIQKVSLPLPRVGDLVAIPVAGAYHLAMASNYNMTPRPAVVVVADGAARLVRSRETYDDLVARDV
ncbi:MAG TPA: diaminopimelate decarboxylase [Candidatus Limnocylindria bacterium]|nr:diaminopimelate decarboxylase [Candidatus Limnocylindria bacterium]